MSVQDKAIEQAIKFLQAAGAQYQIKFAGVEWKNFDEKPPRAKRGDFKLHYQPFIDKMKAENIASLDIQVPEGIDVSGFRGALASAMIKEFGKGNVITEIDNENRIVHVLHV